MSENTRLDSDNNNNKSDNSSFSHPFPTPYSSLSSTNNSNGSGSNNNNVVNFPAPGEIEIPFPPPINKKDLLPQMKRGRIPIRATNQFLLYRTALIKTLRKFGYQDFNMRLISKLASDFWNHEPEYVQAAYKNLANQAKNFHSKTMKTSKKSSRNNIKDDNNNNDSNDDDDDHHNQIKNSNQDYISDPNYLFTPITTNYNENNYQRHLDQKTNNMNNNNTYYTLLTSSPLSTTTSLSSPPSTTLTSPSSSPLSSTYSQLSNSTPSIIYVDECFSQNNFHNYINNLNTTNGVMISPSYVYNNNNNNIGNHYQLEQQLHQGQFQTNSLLNNCYPIQNLY